MDTTEQFEAWRAEIEADVAEARQEETSAAEELATATVTRNAAHARFVALRFTLSGLSGPLPTPIAQRLHQIERDVQTADGAVARGTGLVANTRIRVADLEGALSQLTQLIALPPIEEPADELAEVAQ